MNEGGVRNKALAISEKHVTRHSSPNKTELRNFVFHSHNSRNRDALRKPIMGISKYAPTQCLSPHSGHYYDRPVTAFVAKISMRLEYSDIIWHTGSPQMTPRSKASSTICATTPWFILSWISFFLPRFSYLSTLRRRMILPALLSAASGTGHSGASE
jgi:hypothetical protein